MRCVYTVYTGIMLVISSRICSTPSMARSINEHTDSGNCPGEVRQGNAPWVPNHYSLYLDLRPQQKDFKGIVNITGTLLNSSNSLIELHSVNLNVNSVTINHELLDNGDWYVDENAGILSIIKPPNNVDKSRSFVVSISYGGIFNDTDGVIMKNYGNSNTTRWIIYTFLQPISARQVFPCIDLPKYKATFDINIKNPGDGLVVLSNMPQEGSDSEVIRFKTTPRMSTYLVAFVVCDYVPLKSRRNVTTWVPKELKDNLEIKRIAEITPQLLEQLESYTNSTYSLPKLDQYVTPGGSKNPGMENLGLIMYDVDSLIMDPEYPHLRNPTAIVVHELAHHWFGNSVTVADWCDYWIQEAIPKFLEGVILSRMTTSITEVEAKTDTMERLKWTTRKVIMHNESVSNYDDLIIIKGDPTEDGLMDDFFSLTRYYKGASVMFMLESLVTNQAFQDSLQSFTKIYNHSYASGNELWQIIEHGEQGAGITLPDKLSMIVERWETNRSHPVILLSRTEDGKLHATQRVSSVLNPRMNMAGDWWVPITYTTNGSNPDFRDTSTKSWIPPQTDEPLPLNITLRRNEWIVMNVLGSGFYRVQYDDTTWALLVDQLKRDHTVIPPINRAILIDDSFHTALDIPGGGGLVRAFEIMQYVKRELNPIVWDALRLNIEFYYKAAPDDETKKLFKKYVIILMEDVFWRVADTTAWKSTTMEHTDERWLRKLVFGLSYKMKSAQCLYFSDTITRRVISGSMHEDSVPPEIRDELWCAVMEEYPSLFEHVLKVYNSETDKHKKTKLLQRLQCSTNLNLILQIDEAKESRRQFIKDFLIRHWPGECGAILSFFEVNKAQLLSDNESKLEFGNLMTNPPPQCTTETDKLFSRNDSSDIDKKDNALQRDIEETWNIMWKELRSWLKGDLQLNLISKLYSALLRFARKLLLYI